MKLSLLKDRTNLSEELVDAWYAVVAEFPTDVVDAACVELGVTDGAFPGVDKLYALCRARVPREYAPGQTGRDCTKPGKVEIQRMAKRLDRVVDDILGRAAKTMT